MVITYLTPRLDHDTAKTTTISHRLLSSLEKFPRVLRSLVNIATSSLTGKVRFSEEFLSNIFLRSSLLGELRHINKLRFWPLEAVLHDKYLFPKEDADAIASFLNPMLRLHPDKRTKASDLMHHNWLDGIMVQGEVDVIRRMEEDEARRKRDIAANSREVSRDRGRRRVSALSQSEADAMKPVDDVETLGGLEQTHHPHLNRLSLTLASSSRSPGPSTSKGGNIPRPTSVTSPKTPKAPGAAVSPSTKGGSGSRRRGEI